MLTKVTAYSQWSNVDPLVLNVINQPETDLFEVRNISGMDSVKADVNTTPFGSIDGSSYNGSNTPQRNLVFTLGLNPDWDEWTVSRLRRLLDKYFLPKLSIRLVFETMEFSPVEISGYIESNEANIFSKDPEHQISILCPGVYFKTVDPKVITGDTTTPPQAIEYEGNVETGINVEIVKASGADANYVGVRVHDPEENSAKVDPSAGAAVDAAHKVQINTIPGDKYSRQVAIPGGAVTNRLKDTTFVGTWPLIGPGTVDFSVFADAGVHNWTLTYNDLFGSL